ncbi:hypothetical protein T02_14225 [Trichinella nativa]|uniref:Uncharacterized protein n=1 Tax=Trichinella nativa TaxID=6335 RepID=A0A0V1KLL6_9BILA|nr:hypothetical protein T02_14225 [Trichinella nativa]
MVPLGLNYIRIRAHCSFIGRCLRSMELRLKLNVAHGSILRSFTMLISIPSRTKEF